MRRIGKKVIDRCKQDMVTFWLIVGIVVVGMGVNFATAHDGGKIHNRAQEFSSNYDAEHGVYCGWRHSYEGISCVKVGD
jgi:hypothetical protein